MKYFVWSLALFYSMNAASGIWSAGALLSFESNPYARAKDKWLPLPFFQYTGDTWYFNPATVQNCPIKGMRWDACVSLRTHSGGFDRADYQINRFSDHRTALELGSVAAANGLWGAAWVMAHRDISSVHDGFSLGFQYQYSLYAGVWRVTPSLYWTWNSDALVNYYYGVNQAQASATIPAYHTGAASNIGAGLELLYKLQPRTWFVLQMNSSQLHRNITASPLVDAGRRTAAATGIVYEW